MSNDRFRFRVWDNENNEYLDEAYPSSIYSDGSLYAFEEKYDANSNEMVALFEIQNNCLTVEQCTGLEDENGKLIFEGDKVRMTEFYFDRCGESERNFVGYVMWNKGEFVLSKNPEYENETEIIPHISWGHSFEIVGNIHEEE